MDQYSDPNAPLNFDDLFGPQIYNPALGLTLAKNPEVLAMHFAASGQPPPQENLPPIPLANPSTTQHTIEPKDASEAPGGLDQPWYPPGPDPTAIHAPDAAGGGFLGALRKLLPSGPTTANANPVEGSVPGSPAPALGAPVDVANRPIAEPPVGGPLDIMPPGASAKPPNRSRLADALAALKALTPPAPPRISSPAAPHPSGHIPPSQILQLVQSLSGGGQLGPQRTLGELLSGR